MVNKCVDVYIIRFFFSEKSKVPGQWYLHLVKHCIDEFV